MELKIDSVNAKEFQGFVKKLLSIDRFIFMKLSPTETSSSVYFAQRDAVKQVTVDTHDIFTITDNFNDMIKISFFDGSRIIEALSQFTSDEIKGKIVYDNIAGELIASDFIIYDDYLEIKLFCSDPSLNFMDMTDDEKQRAFGTTNALFDFEMTTDQIDKISSLFKLDKERDIFVIESNSNGRDGVFVTGENYNQILTSAYNTNTAGANRVTIYKKYISLLDKESYNTTICDNKVVLKSNESNTYLTIAVCMDEDEDDL